MDHFKDFYNENYNKVLYYLVKISSNKNLSEDITQETFYRVLIYGSQRKSFSINLAWLIKVAHRLFIDWIRKNSKNVYADINFFDEITNTQSVNVELKMHINDTLNLLSPREKSLILLRDYFGFKYHEIKEITNLSISNIKISIHRARKKFREVYKNEK